MADRWSEAREILVAALGKPHVVDLTWVEELITVGNEAGGVELDVPADEEATAADFGDR